MMYNYLRDTYLNKKSWLHPVVSSIFNILQIGYLAITIFYKTCERFKGKQYALNNDTCYDKAMILILHTNMQYIHVAVMYLDRNVKMLEL